MITNLKIIYYSFTTSITFFTFINIIKPVIKDFIDTIFTYFSIVAYFTNVKDKTFSYINCYFIERIIDAYFDMYTYMMYIKNIR